ncbi:MAG: HEAT repeat domain-containing protein, partial [Firmicutes bacterium]|nr:HEAT repeat domain-containing protein [Bacillota bacterium]
EFFYRLVNLPGLWQSDRPLFWSTLAVLLIFLIIIVFLMVLLLRRKKDAPDKAPAAPTVFVPLEAPDDSIQGAMLSPEEQIATAQDNLDAALRDKLIQDAADSLPLIVRVYDRCSPAVQQELAGLVKSEKMMEEYAARLKDGASQGVLAEAWRLFPDEEALRCFVDMLADPDEEAQRAAVRLLSALKETKMLPLLVLALVKPEQYLPARVAEVFLSMPKESVYLLSYMLPELDDKHKQSVLEIIGQAGVRFDPKNVIACLDHRDLRIRAAAMLALGSGHITEALPRLLAAANDKSWQVRAVAAKALGLLGDSRAVPVLDALSHDGEGWVAEAARQALTGFYNS